MPPIVLFESADGVSAEITDPAKDDGCVCECANARLRSGFVGLSLIIIHDLPIFVQQKINFDIIFLT